MPSPTHLAAMFRQIETRSLFGLVKHPKGSKRAILAAPGMCWTRQCIDREQGVRCPRTLQPV